MTPDPRRARLEELLGVEATQGLSPPEATELDALLAIFPDEDPDGLERAAAAVHLALAPPPEEMPAALAEKLHLAAVALAPTAPATTPRAPRARPAWLAWSGWAVAASLAIALLYTQWPQPSVEKQRARLERDETAHAKKFDDSKPDKSANVIWSNEKQEGYLEVRGLTPNDPTKEQYQLWIVDAARTDPDHKQPVSGGVFDVKPDGTALVRVQASVPVKNAKVFAITKEPPGGSIVSKGPMLLVMTKPG